jgi:glycosyltransferase involved in cell wall biosynthesis
MSSTSLVDQTMLSIAVITYNHARWIKECLDGIDSQQFSERFEVQIGDDASTDSTTQICAEYAALQRQDGNTVTHQIRDRADPRRKQYDAVFMPNAVATLRSCRGKYIAIIEGDDVWTDPAKLESQVRFLEENGDYSMVIHNATVRCDPPRGEMPLWVDTIKRPEYSIDRDFKALDWPSVLFPSCSVVVRREVVERLISSGLAFGPAWDSTILYLAETFGKIRFMAAPMGCYRIHAGACWNGPASGDRYEVMLRFAARLIEFVPELTPEVRAWVQTLFDYNYLSVATNSPSSKDFHERIQCIFPEGIDRYHQNVWLASVAANSILNKLDLANALRQSNSYRLGNAIVETLKIPERAFNWLRHNSAK